MFCRLTLALLPPAWLGATVTSLLTPPSTLTAPRASIFLNFKLDLMTRFLSAVDHEEQQHEEHHEVEDENEHGRPRQILFEPRDSSFL